MNFSPKSRPLYKVEGRDWAARVGREGKKDLLVIRTSEFQPSLTGVEGETGVDKTVHSSDFWWLRT